MKALVIGGTGLVGSELIDLLSRDDRFGEVVSFVRHSAGSDREKVTEHFIDFGDPATWRELVTGDVLFSCLGTTRSAAGGKEEQRVVDYTYQYNFAAGAAGNGVKNYVLVSSVGADPGSRFFYPRIKGELERSAMQLPLENISILRPTQLYGKRRQDRPGERAALSAVRGLNRIGIMTAHRPVNARTVAAAMIECSLFNHGHNVYEVENIRKLSAAYNERMIRENPGEAIVATTEL